jgi:YidC/Oxa1 family membrane protein insertase
MDRKTLLIVAICVVFWFGLNQIIDRVYPPPPRHATVATNSVPLTGTITTNAVAAPATTTAATNAAPTHAERFAVDTNAPEEVMVATNENARYTFTSHGGGLKLVELLHYPETVRRRNGPPAGGVATLNGENLVPTLAVLDGETIQGDGIFHLSRIDNGVRAEKQLPSGLNIIKEFTLSSNYLVSATVRFENQSGQPLSLPEQKWVVGTATPMSADDNGFNEGVMWHNGAKAFTVGPAFFSDRKFGCFPRTPPTEYREGQSNVVWAAVHNQFFTLAAMPQRDLPLQISAREINLPPPSAEEAAANSRVVLRPKGYEASLIYPALTLGANQAVERQFYLYAGPKEFQTLARIAAIFNNNLDAVMNFGWASFFSKALLLAMNWLHSTLHISYGWVIIAITVIIKTLFWPLTQASTRSMKRMQALQPQMKAIADKYKDDPVKRNQKTMEFMKENKVNPMGGCLPMLLQMPVFIGFFYMIRSAIELRGASFLWVTDLSRPDTLFTIPGLNMPFNLLPLLMGGTMLWQAHLTPPSPGMDPAQQKIMRYMPLMFMIFLYNYSAGLALYWTVNNLLTILQTKLTKTREAKAAAAPKGPVLTAPPKKKK